MMRTTGFSLIELMMVVTITGMIAIFAVPNYMNTVNRANEKADINNLLLIRSAHYLVYNRGEPISPGVRLLDNATTTPFVDGGINQLLSLSIVAAPGQTYAYWKNGGFAVPTFLACSYRPGNFSICITDGPINATNPGCNRTGVYATKPCPSVADR